MADPAPVAPAIPPPAPVDLKAQLEKLKKAVQGEKDQVTQITKAIAVGQQDIGVLESGLSDIDQTVNAYVQAVKAAGDVKSFNTFIDHEGAIATAAVGAGKADLDNDITASDNEITKQKAIVDADKTAGDKAAKAYADAQNAAGEKQRNYDGDKATVGVFQAWVADLKTLKTQVTAAAGVGNFGAMYLLVHEMAVVWAKLIQLTTPDAIRDLLVTALSELQTAKSDLRDKKDAVDAAAAQLLADQKKLDDLTKGRRAALLDKVKDWKPPAARAPAVAAPTIGPEAKV
jgi:hypothetical protein